MTSDLKTDQERFQQLITSFYQDFKLTDSLQRLRAKYWDHFLTLGLPDRRNEVYRYINLRQLFAKEYTLAELPKNTLDLSHCIFPECQGSVIVFVNGFYQPNLSNFSNLNKNVLITPLTDAVKMFGSLLNNQTVQRLQKEKDPFASLNGALNASGSFIYISPKTIIDAPIQILQVFDTKDDTFMMAPKVEIFMGSESEASFISSSSHLSGTHYFVNASINFSIEENAKAFLTQSVMDLSEEAWYFDALRASLKRDSSLHTVCVTNGGQAVRFDYSVDLMGENSDCRLDGLWALKNKTEAHSHVLMNHLARDTRSMQFFKGVLNDHAHSSFEGKIYVHREAQKTQAFQLNNNLLLSDFSHADSKPNLEIFADDVKASHGATVGQLDNEQLFYLRTRGLSEHDARNLLVLGFCNEILDIIPHDPLKKTLTKRLHQLLKG